MNGIEPIGTFLETTSSEPIFAPTVALYETFIGAVRVHGEPGLESVQIHLDWVEPIQLSLKGASEAALVEAELPQAGLMIGPLDTLIAGIVRNIGGTVVTRDDHFERVSGLKVVRYDLDDGDSTDRVDST